MSDVNLETKKLHLRSFRNEIYYFLKDRDIPETPCHVFIMCLSVSQKALSDITGLKLEYIESQIAIILKDFDLLYINNLYNHLYKVFEHKVVNIQKPEIPPLLQAKLSVLGVVSNPELIAYVTSDTIKNFFIDQDMKATKHLETTKKLCMQILILLSEYDESLT